MRNGLRILAVISDLLRYFAALCLVPIPVAFVYDPWGEVWGIPMPVGVFGFALTAVVTFSAGWALHWVSRKSRAQDMHEQEAYVAVAWSWLVMTVAGALPFVIHLGDPVDAWFESMSGLTATGATIFPLIDGEAPSIIFWRALLQFAAGLGIVVVGVALLARLTHGGSQLLATDIGGSRLRPKLRETAATIWQIYASLAAILAVLYTLAMRFTGIGVPWRQAIFDGIVHSFATVSTGGFSSHNESLGYYESIVVEAIAVVFMIAAATSFALWYKSRKHPKYLLQDDEWRFYMAIIAIGTLVMWALLWYGGEHPLMAWRAGVFTMVSVGSTTGFMTVDHDTWPTLARSLLLVGMFVGGMAGSTAGGMKTLRILLLLRVARRELRRLLHPRAVIPIRLGRKAIEEQTLLTIIAFFFTYVTVWMVGAAFLVAAEPDLGMLEGGAAAAAAMSNTGPAMGIVGPFNSYEPLSDASKIVLGALMWIGRVEVFSALLIFGRIRLGR